MINGSRTKQSPVIKGVIVKITTEVWFDNKIDQGQNMTTQSSQLTKTLAKAENKIPVPIC